MSRRWLVAVSLVAHLSIVIGVFVSGLWRFERLTGEHRYLRGLGVMLPPPESSGGPIAVTPQAFVAKQRKVVKERRQPEPPDDSKLPEIGTGSGSGSGSGSQTDTGQCHENCDPGPPADPVCGNAAVEAGEDCDDGNLSDGDGCSATCRIEPRRPPPPPQPVGIHAGVLQSLRISGETQVHPSATTQSQMVHDGGGRFEGRVTLCLDTSGNVVSTQMTQSTRYPDYDRALLAAIRDWRYRPYQRNGTALPACSTVTFVYTIR